MRLLYNAKTTNSSFGWETVELSGLEAQIVKTGTLYTDVKGTEIKKENINTIIKTNYLAGDSLVPGGTSSKTLKLALTKLISNTEDDMTYNNDVEVITATKTGGRTIVKQLGTYTFESGNGVGGSAEEITITPPTGILDGDTIYYVIIAVATVALLTTGLVFISLKRKNK